MDILQRAADMLDRAQERVNGATQQAARVAYTVAQLRELEARQVDLRAQLEAAVSDLGKLTFQRWKNHGVGNDDALASLCRNIDTLNAAYQGVLGAIADARASAMAPMAGVSRGTRRSHGGYPMLNGRDLAPGQPQPYVDYSLPPADAMTYETMQPKPQAPARQSRECPECFTLVPGASHFCPSCGMKV